MFLLKQKYVTIKFPSNFLNQTNLHRQDTEPEIASELQHPGHLHLQQFLLQQRRFLVRGVRVAVGAPQPKGREGKIFRKWMGNGWEMEKGAHLENFTGL